MGHINQVTAISIANAAALTALPVTGFVPGTIAYVQSRGTFWSYQPTSAGPASGFAIAANGGGFWEYICSGIANDATTQASWYIDPVSGSDDNTGLSQAAAVKTIAEIFRRYGTRTPYLNQATIFWLLNSQPLTDAWSGYSPVLGPSGSLVVTAPLGGAAGTPALTATLEGFTPVNPSAGVNARATITVTGQTWSTYTGKNYLVVGPTYQFHLGTDLGSGVAAIDTPFDILAGIGSPFGTYATPEAGDTIHVYAQPTLYMDEVDCTITDWSITFLNLDLKVSVSTMLVRQEVFFFGCTFSSGIIQTPGAQDGQTSTPFATGCHFNVNANVEGAFQFYGTGLDGEGVYTNGTNWDGDCWVAFRIHYGNAGTLYLRRVGFGQTNDIDVGTMQWLIVPSNFAGKPAAVYGAGVDVSGGSTMSNRSGTPYATVMTGGALFLDGGTTACAWNGAGVNPAATFTPASCDSATQYSPIASGSFIASPN